MHKLEKTIDFLAKLPDYQAAIIDGMASNSHDTNLTFLTLSNIHFQTHKKNQQVDILFEVYNKFSLKITIIF